MDRHQEFRRCEHPGCTSVAVHTAEKVVKTKWQGQPADTTPLGTDVCVEHGAEYARDGWTLKPLAPLS